MNYYEKLYTLKDDKQSVKKYIEHFLLFQIYSPTVLRCVYSEWLSFPWYLRKNTPAEIYTLIEKTPCLKDHALQKRLNEYTIRQAVHVLSNYQACDIPMTQDKTIPQNRYKLTSEKGDKALMILQNALNQKQFTDKMADLAIRTSHKFLMDDKYYIKWKIDKKLASMLVVSAQEENEKEKSWIFPAIQLTRGCLNHCSHCDSRAEPHLSHMPWPVFKGLYRTLNHYYRHYPQTKTDYYFSNFFADSDMLDYNDSILNVDSGDVGLWISAEGGDCQYLTRGVKNEQNKLAMAKALLSSQAFGISFVDTTKENMNYNLKQLAETLDVVESIPRPHTIPIILHRHLKSGPSVDKKVFRNFPLEQKIIYPLGRAKDFPTDEVQNLEGKTVFPKFIFRPNGDLDWQEEKNGDLHSKKCRNILSNQNVGPKINPIRLFMRRHILSLFKSK